MVFEIVVIALLGAILVLSTLVYRKLTMPTSPGLAALAAAAAASDASALAAGNAAGSIGDSDGQVGQLAAQITGNLGTIDQAISKIAPLTAGPAVAPVVTVGVTYSLPLTITGGVGSYSSEVSGGSLPDGLSLADNAIAGTAGTAGTFSADVTVSDSALPSPSSTVLALSFEVLAPPPT